MWGQLALSTAFVLLTSLMMWLALLRVTASRWVYALYLLAGLIGALLFPLASFDVYLLPTTLRRLLQTAPRTYLGLEYVFLLVVGMLGLIRNHAKAETYPHQE